MLERIRKNLSAGPREPAVPEGLTAAAVLFPLLFKKDELHVLFTKRTQTVKVHKGQVSFPGGVRDSGDESLQATALREAQEEIGLNPEDVEIFGVLDPITTVTTGFVEFFGTTESNTRIRISSGRRSLAICTSLSGFGDSGNFVERR